jgi:23S rRNA (uracil1939-C5)-methyltransferase
VTTTPYCRHQPECTGCPLSHAAYPEQLRLKARRVEGELMRSPITSTIAVQPTLGANATDGYRLRAKLVHDEGRLGLYSEAHAVIDTTDCRIVHPDLQRVLNAIRQLLPLASPLLAVDARIADEGVLLTLVAPKGSAVEPLRDAAERIRAAAPLVAGVAYAERDVKSPQVLGGTPRPLLGRAELRHTFSPDQPYHLAVFGGFVQAHAGQTKALHDAMVQALRARWPSLNGLRVVELYAGAGALALRLAALGARVTAVDSYAPSIELVERAANAQHLAVTALASEAEDALAKLRGADVVIVDPPRRGLSVEVRQAIAGATPKAVVYVSCDPKTLARDLVHFAWLGYRAASALPVDMIPQSNAVETLVVLEPSPPPALDVLYRDEQLIAVNKPAHIPTIPHGEYTHSLLAFVQAIPGCEHAAPVHRLDVGTSGVCLFAVHPKYAQQLGQALAAGQKTYVALAQGITHKRGKIRKALLEGRVPREAETRYQRVDVAGTHSLIHAHPIHGRKHQIRRHFASVGHPLLGDGKYSKGSSARFFFDRHGLDRPFLHCARIELTLASTPVDIQAGLAPDLQRALDSLTSAEPTSTWRDD